MIVFGWCQTQKKLTKRWCMFLRQHWELFCFFNKLLNFEIFLGVVGYLKKSKYLWINVHRKMGAFSVRFVFFTSTLVYSVVCNQSPITLDDNQ